MLIPDLKVDRGHDLTPSMDTVWDLLQRDKCVHIKTLISVMDNESLLYIEGHFVCSAWIIQVIVRKSSKKKGK